SPRAPCGASAGDGRAANRLRRGFSRDLNLYLFDHFLTMNLFRIVALLASLAVWQSLPASSSPASESERPLVCASTEFLADIVRQVAGDRVRVRTIFPPGTDLHSHRPLPAEITSVADSQLLVLNGL